jgi:hypothetical protein
MKKNASTSSWVTTAVTAVNANPAKKPEHTSNTQILHAHRRFQIEKLDEETLPRIGS